MRIQALLVAAATAGALFATAGPAAADFCIRDLDDRPYVCLPIEWPPA